LAIAARACCAEFDEKQPSAQGIITSAIVATLPASGQAASDSAIANRVTVTARAGPRRSMRRETSTLPSRPKAPNHRNSRLTSPALAPSTCR